MLPDRPLTADATQPEGLPQLPTPPRSATESEGAWGGKANMRKKTKNRKRRKKYGRPDADFDAIAEQALREKDILAPGVLRRATKAFNVTSEKVNEKKVRCGRYWPASAAGSSSRASSPSSTEDTAPDPGDGARHAAPPGPDLGHCTAYDEDKGDAFYASLHVSLFVRQDFDPDVVCGEDLRGLMRYLRRNPHLTRRPAALVSSPADPKNGENVLLHDNYEACRAGGGDRRRG